LAAGAGVVGAAAGEFGWRIFCRSQRLASPAENFAKNIFWQLGAGYNVRGVNGWLGRGFGFWGVQSRIIPEIVGVTPCGERPRADICDDRDILSCLFRNTLAAATFSFFGGERARHCERSEPIHHERGRSVWWETYVGWVGEKMTISTFFDGSGRGGDGIGIGGAGFSRFGRGSAR